MVSRKPSEVLVSWVSIQHAAAPLLSVIDDEDSELRGRVTALVLCYRDAGEDTERQALAATRAGIERLPAAKRPEIVERPWKTRARPTDHEKIRAFTEGVLKETRDRWPDARINIHLSPGTKAMHAVWLLLGATGFVSGPVRLIQTHEHKFRRGEPPFEEVKTHLDTWMRRIRETKPVADIAADDERLWDPASIVSPNARSLLERIDRWAPLPVPILILGERGTGKTTLANILRARSSFRRLKRWPGVVVCGQFRANPELARSELFGHSKGAFTGANTERKGLLETLDGDTLFLDEIADLDASTQRLLIAAVEGRGFQRLGDGETRRSRFRLLAATNQPLASLRGDVLDEDFLDRIATFVLRLPALRERRADLPELWRAALSRVADEAAIVPERISELATHRVVLDCIAAHPLPGNLRDLHRAAWRAIAALSAGDSGSDAAAEAIEAFESTTPAPWASIDFLPTDLRAHLDAEEHRYLAAALQQANGNKTAAAERLGLARKTFDYGWNRLEKAATLPAKNSRRRR